MGRAKQNLTGRRFGRWQVLNESPSSGNVRWLCVCDCGVSRSVTSSNLLHGLSTSCGCRKDEVTIARSTVHGRYGTPAYNSWRGMVSRCTNESQNSYKYYGGRGVTICERWREFAAFYEDMGDPPANGYSIDRIDVNGDYEPGNCRWADQATQVRNRRPRERRAVA